MISEEDDGSLLQSQSNLEEIARKKRYDFFQRVALEIGAQKVALGHTANDQVETFFLWIFRGTGTKGLGGIPPVREDIFIRPLIEVGRKEIIEFLQQERIPWVEDSSNQKRKYLRNRIRHILIPKLLDEFDPQLIEKVVKTTEILRSEDLFLEKLSLEKFNDLKKEGEEKEIYFSVGELKKLPDPLKRRIIRHAIQEIKGTLRRINFNHLEAIFRIMKSGAPNLKVSLPSNLEVCKEYDHLKFRIASQEKIQFHHEFDSLPKEIKIPEISRKIEIEVLDWNSANLPLANKNSALMDYNKIKFPIIVRNWKPGDRFQPLGMHKYKKVKDFFIDSKLPLSERKKIPLILFADHIAWVGGQRIDERVKVTNVTRKAIKMEIH